MEYKELEERAVKVRNMYNELNIKNGHKIWNVSELTQGLVGDIGDLVKLIMAKEGFRKGEDLDHKIPHELADCLWALIIISRMLGIDLEKAFLQTMDELEERINAE